MAEKMDPLRDDLTDWASGCWWRALLVAFFPNTCLANRLKAQLKARPCVWGIGLWSDKETEEVARGCAEDIECGYGCGSTNFIPDDPINLIEDLDPTHDFCGCEAVMAIEGDFNCTIPESVLCDCTFGDFVNAVKAGRGQNQAASSTCDTSDANTASPQFFQTPTSFEWVSAFLMAIWRASFFFAPLSVTCVLLMMAYGFSAAKLHSVLVSAVLYFGWYCRKSELRGRPFVFSVVFGAVMGALVTWFMPYGQMFSFFANLFK